MLKQIVALLMLVAVMAQTYSKAIIVFSYYTHTASYAENCINKSRPYLHCNGKCQMVKQLTRDDDKSRQAALHRLASNDVMDPSSFFISPTNFLQKNNAALYAVFQDADVKQMPRFCFHPPGTGEGV